MVRTNFTQFGCILLILICVARAAWGDHTTHQLLSNERWNTVARGLVSAVPVDVTGARWENFKRLVVALANEGELVIRQIATHAQGDHVLNALLDLQAKLSTEALQRAFVRKLKDVSLGHGGDAMRWVIQTLRQLNAAVVEELVNSATALQHMGKVLARKAVNNVDADELRKVLGNDVLFPAGAPYTRSMVLADMEKVADAKGLNKLLPEKGIEGAAPGLASKEAGNVRGALLELQAAAKYAEDGQAVKAVRQGFNGKEVDIALVNNTFAELTLGNKSDNVRELTSGWRKLELLKTKGATKVEFVFGEASRVSPKWVAAMQERAQSLGLPVEFRRLKINPNGTKEWLPL